MINEITANFIGNFLNMSTVANSVVFIIPKIIYIVFILLLFFIIYEIIKRIIIKSLMYKAKTKKQKNNVVVFIHLWKYIFVFITLLVLIFTWTGSLTGLGLSAALLTAALGWALQKPISGVAAWLIIVTKKPFHIGDRIIIGDVKGDVIDITLTHIYLNELGGTIASEESSGRTIMIPNAILFEKNIINYTYNNEYILDQVVTPITYESDIDVAIKVCKDAAEKITKDSLKNVPSKPFVRTYFQPSGVDIKVRYYTAANERQKISSDITQAIFKKINSMKNVNFAYPHTEVLLKKR
ncbi:MAG: mechanosensitive ion channel [Candidatus Aenigmarchaeota archaeon]|nr:mechanosensitive ion channel [Candidatus Aenigmarchaeota archaeon]